MFRSWPGRSQAHAGIPLEPLSDWRACCGALLTMLRVVGEFKDLGYRAMTFMMYCANVKFLRVKPGCPGSSR